MFCIVRFIAIELVIGAVWKKKKTECLSQIGNLESMKEERDLTFPRCDWMKEGTDRNYTTFKKKTTIVV